MNPYRTSLISALGVASFFGVNAPAQEFAKDKTVGNLEIVARFESGPMPTGVTVSKSGRIFLNYPHWGDHVDATEEQVAATVRNLREKGMSDGMESDTEGNVYFGDLENDSVRRWSPDGSFALIAHDPRILWPDTLSLAQDGYLYFTANQLHRMAKFHGGHDLRMKPYVLFRIKVDGYPIP